MAHNSGGRTSDDGRLSWGYSSFMGRRSSMEDFFDIKAAKIGNEAVYLFGVFDGHGGSHAAKYLEEHLFDNLIKHPNFMTDTNSAIIETYKQTDNDFLEAELNSQRDDGSTASTGILIGNHLYIANVGDSRAVISKAGAAVQLSEDHKPNRTDERKRIENAGGVVMWAGAWRVGGILAMSRAFGDRLLKQFVVADPDIRVETVEKGLDFLVLASDGLWDNVSNEEAVALVKSIDEPEEAARKLTDTAFDKESGDNITCIVVRFHHDDTTPAGSPSGSPDHPSTSFPPTASSAAAGSSSSGGSVASLAHATDAGSTTSGGSLDNPLAGTAGFPPSAKGSSSVSLGSLFKAMDADSTLAGSLDAIPSTIQVDPLAGTADFLPHTSVAGSSSAGNVDSLLHTTAVGSTLPGNLDTIAPAPQDYHSAAETADFPPPTSTAGSSSAGTVDPSSDAMPPTRPQGCEDSPIHALMVGSLDDTPMAEGLDEIPPTPDDGFSFEGR